MVMKSQAGVRSMLQRGAFVFVVVVVKHCGMTVLPQDSE